MCLFRSMRRSFILHAREAETLHLMTRRSRRAPRMSDERLPSELRKDPPGRDGGRKR
jgi:hypothetical protein